MNTNEQDEIRLPHISREQVLAVGGTILASGAVDLAVHFNPAVILAGVVATYAVGKLTPEVMAMMMVPGSNPDEVVDALEKIAGPAPAPHPDQRALSKIKRLVGIKTPVPAQPKDERDDDEQASEEESAPTKTEQKQDRPAGPIFPPYPDEETWCMGTVLTTGQRCDPHANTLLGYGLFVGGSQGSGKSNFLALTAESIGRWKMSEIIFDFKGEYTSLMSVVPNGFMAGSAKFVASYGPGAFELTPETAASFAECVMEARLQAVVNIPSYGGDFNYVATIMTALIKGLMAWSEAQRPADRMPCWVAWDEAHVYFPEGSSNGFDKDVNKKLDTAMNMIVYTGRSYGYTLGFFTQRIANISKTVVSQCQVKVIMRHTLDNDLKRCAEEVGKTVADPDLIKNLDQGVGIIVGLTKKPLILKFDERQTRHDSHTPDISRVHRRPAQRVSSVLNRMSRPGPMGPSPEVPRASYEHENAIGSQRSRTVPAAPETRLNVLEKLDLGNKGDRPESPDAGDRPEGFSCGPNDKIFTSVQERQFVRLYRRAPGQEIKSYLRTMGVGNSFAKYARHVVAYRLNMEDK